MGHYRYPRTLILSLMMAVGLGGAAWGDDDPIVRGRPLSRWVATLKDGSPFEKLRATLVLELLGPEARTVVPALIKIADDAPGDLQRSITDIFEWLGPNSPEVVPALISRYEDERSEGNKGVSAKIVSMNCLISIGPAALPSLCKDLDSKDERSRGLAAVALGEIGPKAASAAPALARAVRAWRDGERDLAATALARIGPGAAAAIPALHEAYDLSKPKADSSAILDALIKIGGPPSPGMIQQLIDTDPEVRALAAWNLGDFGPKAQAATPRLITALDDPSERVRVEAAIALAAIDPVNRRSLPTLIRSLASDDLEVLERAIPAISRFGPKARLAVPRLREIVARTTLKHAVYAGDQLLAMVAEVKTAAAEALCALDPGSEEGVTKLIDLWGQYRDGSVIQALGRLGPRARAAVPILLDLAEKGERPCYRFESVKALLQIEPGNKAIRPKLLTAIDQLAGSPDNDLWGNDEFFDVLATMNPESMPALVRCVERGLGGATSERAAMMLGRLGPIARVAVPALLAALRQEGIDREAAQEALCAIGPPDAAVPTLLDMLKTEENRSWVAPVLGAIGPGAGSAVPALLDALNDNNDHVAAVVGAALMRIDPSKREKVERRLAVTESVYARAVLAGALGRMSPEADLFTGIHLRTIDNLLDGSVENRIEICVDRLKRLGELGAGARSAIPRLAELKDHPEPEIQRQAAMALRRIQASLGVPRPRRQARDQR